MTSCCIAWSQRLLEFACLVFTLFLLQKVYFAIWIIEIGPYSAELLKNAQIESNNYWNCRRTASYLGISVADTLTIPPLAPPLPTCQPGLTGSVRRVRSPPPSILSRFNKQDPRITGLFVLPRGRFEDLCRWQYSDRSIYLLWPQGLHTPLSSALA